MYLGGRNQFGWLFSVSQQAEHCIPFLWTVTSHDILKTLFKLQDSHILHSAGDSRKTCEARVILTLDRLSNWVLGTKIRTFSANSYDPETNKKPEGCFSQDFPYFTGDIFQGEISIHESFNLHWYFCY